MTNAFSRPATPEPWPADFMPSGALYGDLPLTVPRPKANSIRVVIVNRQDGVQDGVTTYHAYERNSDTPVEFKIDTCNERILLSGLVVMRCGGSPRMIANDVPVARIVASQNPTSDPTRTHVDHADRDSTNDCASNVHFVTPQFNNFNRTRKKSASGFFGVAGDKGSFRVTHSSRAHGNYARAETAALVYNFVCRLHYGDQLDKASDLLNDIKDEAKRINKLEERADGVQIYSVDDVFIVVYNGLVKSVFDTRHSAAQAADSLLRELDETRRQIEEAQTEERRMLQVQRRASDNVAYFRLATKDGRTMDVLLDDEDWKTVKVESKGPFLSWKDRVFIRPKAGSAQALSRWLLAADAHTQVVDHISGNIYDHRRSNLRATDYSGNGQNCRLERRNKSGFIGVELTEWGPRVVCRVRGQNRFAKRTFKHAEVEKAAAWYDIVSIFQYGPGALINMPHNLDEYLSSLEKDETKADIEEFLAPPDEQSSPFQGVHLRCMRGQFLYWVAKYIFGGDLKQDHVSIAKHGFIGAEVRAAIFYDLRRLDTLGPYITVNFERMRPVYQHLTAAGAEVDKEMVEKAYRLIGGDAFADSVEKDREETPIALDLNATASTSLAIPDSPSPPQRQPSPEFAISKVVLGKRKAQ